MDSISSVEPIIPIKYASAITLATSQSEDEPHDPELDDKIETIKNSDQTQLRANREGIRILGTFEDEVQVLNKPNIPQKNEIDSSALQRWIHLCSKNPNSIRALSQVTQKIRHISFPEFKRALDQCLQNIPPPLMGGTSISLVEPSKSQAWVNEIAIFHLNWHAQLYLALGEAGGERFAQSMRQTPDWLWKKPINVYILDDGSYSGLQMTGNVKAVAKYLQDANAIFHITAVIPFLTITAIKKINKETESFKDKFSLVYTEVISTAKKIITSVTKNKKEFGAICQALWPASTADQINKNLDKNGLLYFEHKVPNSMSFPIGLAEGRVEGKPNCSFIPKTQSPYKNQRKVSG